MYLYQNKMNWNKRKIDSPILTSDFTWEEVRRLLVALGYVPGNKGKTSGSRVIFKGDGLKPIMLHKPHPGNIIKGYVMKQVYDYLKNEGLI